MAASRKLIAGVRDVLTSVATVLPAQDVANAIDLLDHNEWGEALSDICTQMFEYDVRISADIYAQIARLADEMELPEREWAFIRDLVT
jgi:hypothetical protein